MRDEKALFAFMLSLWLTMASVPLLRAETPEETRAKALAVLKSDAPLEQKTAACEDLTRVGDKSCVPVLAGLLGIEQLSHKARYALEPIPDQSVDVSLRAALNTCTGTLLSGVISSIGTRRDAAAVEPLKKYLGDEDADVVRTTAITLGRIGTVAAGKAMLDALKNAKADNVNRICDGLLLCGANLAAQNQAGEAKAMYDGLLSQTLPARLRAAALRGAVLCDPAASLKRLGAMLHDNDLCVFAMALRVAVEMKDKNVTGVLVSEIGKLPADRAIAVVKILGTRADKSALPRLLEMAQKGEKGVRIEAVPAVAEIGDASAAPALVELMKDKDAAIAQAAATALAGLPGPEVDSIIVKMLENLDPVLGLKMIEIAGQRRIAAAMPALRKAMSDKDLAIRTVAVRSYGEQAGESGIPVLLDMLLKSADGPDLGLYERALGSLCPMAGDKDACTKVLIDALAKAGPTVKPALLRTLRVVGGPEALKAVRGAVDDADTQVHAAAVRVLGEWMSIEAAPVLLELAKNSSQPVDKILALRGYLGIAVQRNVSPQDKLAICRQAAPMIQRADEKRMLLGALAAVANAGSLDLITPCLDDPSVKREAVATVMAIAEKRPRKQHAAVAKTALETVVKVAVDDPAVVKRAQELLKQIAAEK